MPLSWSWSNPARSEPAPVRWLLLAMALTGGAAGADTVIQGSVSDAVTRQPLVGAVVEVQRAGDPIGRAVTNASGGYLVTVDVGNRPEAVNLKVFFRHSGYLESDQNAVVTSGRPDRAAYPASLLPEEVAACRAARARRVIVGHFRPPAAATGSDFGARVADAVRYELARLQQSRLAVDQLPSVANCEGIDDRENLPAIARALQADALLSGTVARAAAPSARFNVSMFVGDQHGLFVLPAPITSRDIDLDDPAATRLDPAAMTAILRALLTGYRSAGRFAECVEVSGVAETLLRPPLPAVLAEIRADCQRALPAAGLTR